MLARILLKESRICRIEMNEVKNDMNTHDRNLALMIFMAAMLISVNFFAVITGLADGYYEQITEFLRPILLDKG